MPIIKLCKRKLARKAYVRKMRKSRERCSVRTLAVAPRMMMCGKCGTVYICCHVTVKHTGVNNFAAALGFYRKMSIFIAAALICSAVKFPVNKSADT